MKRTLHRNYDSLTNHERFNVTLAALDRNDDRESGRLLDAAPRYQAAVISPELESMFEGARSCALLFMIEWHLGLRAYTVGTTGAALALAQDDTPDRHDELDDLANAGLTRVLGLLWAWDEFTAEQGLDGPQILRVELAEVGTEIESLRASRFDAWLLRNRAADNDTSLAEVVLRLKADFASRWPIATPV